MVYSLMRTAVRPGGNPMIPESPTENCKLRTENSRKGIGGPKTPEGKLKVSLNALKTGLHASSEQGMAALEEAIGCSYAETLDRMRNYFKPMDPLEDVLVRRIARSTWRMIVTESAENNVLARCAEYVRVTHRYRDV